MKINADFTQRVVVHSEQQAWLSSPMSGVERRPLDRIGDEVARATSIVKYASGSQFSPHVHTGGEEFLVLEGVFQDEHGDFPAGSYIRNPPQSSHQPSSATGCVIMVKLWQYDLTDRVHVRLRTDHMAAVPVLGRPGVAVTPLFEDQHETVSIEKWSPNTEIDIQFEGGVELFVLEGSLEEAGETLVKNSWLRLPEGQPLKAKAGANGTKLWMKSGHLRWVKRDLANLATQG